MQRGAGRGLGLYDVVAVGLGIGVVWSIAGKHHFSEGSLEFACAITLLGVVALAWRLLRY
jgi:hypothetical protein